MPFGQQAGPPATSSQMRRLGELLSAAGHPDFRSARAEYGLNQRQAGGRFTRDEAEGLIALLEARPEAGPETLLEAGPETGSTATPRPAAPRTASKSRPAPDLRRVPSEDLAAELQRRGWAVLQP